MGKALHLASVSRFSSSLSLQLRAGLTISEAISHMGNSVGDTELAQALQQANEGLRAGATLAEALAATEYFPKIFLSFIEAGESSGTLERLSQWVADYYESELETTLEGLTPLLEPIMLAVMGAVTALLLIATLKPTLMILETL